VIVDDQDKAVTFYTEVLGFVERPTFRLAVTGGVTVVSPDGPEGIELALEPIGFLPSRTYQESLFRAGTPAIAFASDDLEAECERLKEAGVVFRDEPADVGAVPHVLFEDTCVTSSDSIEARIHPSEDRRQSGAAIDLIAERRGVHLPAHPLCWENG